MSPNPALLTWPRPAGGSLPAADYVFDFLQAVAYPGTVKLYTHTFSDQSLGDECEDRTIIVAVVTQTNISGITVSGEAVTIDANHGGLYGTRVAVGHVVVPSGTTGDVVVTLNTAPHERIVVALWRHGGPIALASADTDYPISLPVTTGDHVVAARYNTFDAASWTGGVTQDAQTAFSVGDWGNAASMTASSSTTLSISLSHGFGFAGAAYTPA